MTSGDGAHLGLSVWISGDGAARVFYGEAPGYRIAAGVPRASRSAGSALPDTLLADVLLEFEADCRRAGRRPLYFGLPETCLNILEGGGAGHEWAARGRWHAGDLPVFALERWRDPITMPSGIRAQARRARNLGVTVRRLPSNTSSLPESLRACVSSWLQSKPLPPLGFVTTPFLFDPWPSSGVLVAERAGVVEGFLVGSEALLPGVWRVDAIGRAESAPNGCAELLISEAFRQAAKEGHAQATLGLAPLSKRSVSAPPQSRSSAASHWMDRVAEIVHEARVPGYSFAGLEAFKSKFAPDAWIPAWCLTGGGALSLRDMTAIARVFTGGSLTGYALRALRWRLGKRRLSF